MSALLKGSPWQTNLYRKCPKGRVTGKHSTSWCLGIPSPFSNYTFSALCPHGLGSETVKYCTVKYLLESFWMSGEWDQPAKSSSSTGYWLRQDWRAFCKKPPYRQAKVVAQGLQAGMRTGQHFKMVAQNGHTPVPGMLINVGRNNENEETETKQLLCKDKPDQSNSMFPLQQGSAIYRLDTACQPKSPSTSQAQLSCFWGWCHSQTSRPFQ